MIKPPALLAALLLSSAHGAPLLDHDLNTPPRRQLEAAARDLMKLPEAEVLALVPEQTPFITSDCPACGNTHFARGLERDLWKLTLPGTLTCLKCGAQFPSDKFPLNDKATYLNTLGEKVEIAFHRDAKGRRFALPGALQSWQNGWLVEHL